MRKAASFQRIHQTGYFGLFISFSRKQCLPNDPGELPNANAPDKELALWVLEIMHDGKDSPSVIRAARSASGTDILDTHDYVMLHKRHLEPLHQGALEDKAELSEEAAEAIAKSTTRTMKSKATPKARSNQASRRNRPPRGTRQRPRRRSQWEKLISNDTICGSALPTKYAEANKS